MYIGREGKEGPANRRSEELMALDGLGRDGDGGNRRTRQVVDDSTSVCKLLRYPAPVIGLPDGKTDIDLDSIGVEERKSKRSLGLHILLVPLHRG